jgi:hypothetical protein
VLLSQPCRMLASSLVALSLVVHVYDSARVPPTERAAALAVAHAILKDAGIVVEWRDGSGCDQPVERDVRLPNGQHALPELIVRIVVSPAESLPGPLGFSLVDVRLGSGTLATVFADRVKGLARVAGTDPGPLLGRAMAHEVAHLLLGTTRHADRGLMRGTWTTGELRRDSPRDWMLRSDDIEGMRRGLAARAHRLETPAAVMARQDPDISTGQQ